jgi:hypothetical protein
LKEKLGVKTSDICKTGKRQNIKVEKLEQAPKAVVADWSKGTVSLFPA